MSTIEFKKAQFLVSAPTLGHCPPERGKEVAFAGRSNAGKSSAINALTDNPKLARTSKTPGRTQLINYFTLNSDHSKRLVDLPGYGYAKVSKKVQQQWQHNLEEYLQHRETLEALVLVMDIRHPMQEFDTAMINAAVGAEMPVHILLTKADKLKRGAMLNTVRELTAYIEECRLEDLITVQTFSALKKDGVKELKRKLTLLLQENSEAGGSEPESNSEA